MVSDMEVKKEADLRSKTLEDLFQDYLLEADTPDKLKELSKSIQGKIEEIKDRLKQVAELKGKGEDVDSGRVRRLEGALVHQQRHLNEVQIKFARISGENMEPTKQDRTVMWLRAFVKVVEGEVDDGTFKAWGDRAAELAKS